MAPRPLRCKWLAVKPTLARPRDEWSMNRGEGSTKVPAPSDLDQRRGRGDVAYADCFAARGSNPATSASLTASANELTSSRLIKLAR